MPRALELVRGYVLAGFSKIHIDTSMRLADDDPSARLPDETIARRGAELCAAAEDAFAVFRTAYPGAPAPVYVIGSEVPIPGGAMENEETVAVTKPEDCKATLEAFQAAFTRRGLKDAWDRVIALVVQPGVEFADESVVEYDRAAARDLTASLDAWPGLVFEGHSTDYQSKERLREMVEDGIAILKVGPALTFALREGLFALERIEAELGRLRPFPASAFRDTLEWAMRGETTSTGAATTTAMNPTSGMPGRSAFPTGRGITSRPPRLGRRDHAAPQLGPGGHPAGAAQPIPAHPISACPVRAAPSARGGFTAGPRGRLDR
jgi:D-tagatose-1,6-bisphosphate aldolase subunit GatZ/KbaZ